MNVWLATWDIEDYYFLKYDLVVGIFDSRKSGNSILQYLLQFSLFVHSTASEIVSCVHRPSKYPVKYTYPVMKNGVPHGDMLYCGNDLMIYARKVSEFSVQVDMDNNMELLSWREPPEFFPDGRRIPGNFDSIKRSRTALLSLTETFF